MSKLSELEEEVAELFKSSLDAEKLFYLGIALSANVMPESATKQSGSKNNL